MNKLPEITRDKVREVLTHHGSGLKMLLASDRPRDMHLISQVVNYEAVVKRLAGLARFVILDFGVGIQPFAEKIIPRMRSSICHSRRRAEYHYAYQGSDR